MRPKQIHQFISVLGKQDDVHEYKQIPIPQGVCVISHVIKHGNDHRYNIIIT